MILITGIYPKHVNVYDGCGLLESILTNAKVEYEINLSHSTLTGEYVLECNDGKLPDFEEIIKLIKQDVSEILKTVLGES